MGLWVDQVVPGSPAALGGIQRGDVITQISGRQVDHWSQAREMIGDAPPGTTFTLTLRRYDPDRGQWVTKRITVTSIPIEQVQPIP
jgi:S1-C subfamily serine protease